MHVVIAPYNTITVIWFALYAFTKQINFYNPLAIDTFASINVLFSKLRQLLIIDKFLEIFGLVEIVGNIYWYDYFNAHRSVIDISGKILINPHNNLTEAGLIEGW